MTNAELAKEIRDQLSEVNPASRYPALAFRRDQWERIAAALEAAPTERSPSLPGEVGSEG